VSEKRGKPTKPPPEREGRKDALKIDLPFEEALKAALETPPETRAKDASARPRPKGVRANDVDLPPDRVHVIRHK
jgi:hypothetical protein